MKNWKTMVLPRRHAGTSMLEVLITLVVVSVGLLGLAGIQVVTLANAGSAGVGSAAAMLAESLAASISANQAYWGGTDSMGTATGFQPGASVKVSGETLTPAIGKANVDCTGKDPCSPADMAAFDLKEWGARLAKYLPNGAGEVKCAQAPGTAGAGETSPQYLCAITVSWQEKKLKSAADHYSDERNLSSPNLRSYTLVVQQ
ncbi:MAG: type IV pilus modification protein PilV [Betaproteobacteria bacterium]|nr:type IV pilus modification protein PilV [Betaproteobacteria bacterium]